jgi:hypothetical protein
MKKRRKSLPKGPNSAHELDHLVPWEEVFTDSSGKFRRKSKQGNNYFTVFVCAKTGDKIAIPHVKRMHFPLVYFEFTKQMGRHPKVLYSDLASKITSLSFERYIRPHKQYPDVSFEDNVAEKQKKKYKIQSLTTETPCVQPSTWTLKWPELHNPEEPRLDNLLRTKTFWLE